MQPSLLVMLLRQPVTAVFLDAEQVKREPLFSCLHFEIQVESHVQNYQMFVGK